MLFNLGPNLPIEQHLFLPRAPQALAMRRYNRMRPERAFTALHRKWPRETARVVTGVLWQEVKARTVEEITDETVGLMARACDDR
jgi:hypothetical protein